MRDVNLPSDSGAVTETETSLTPAPPPVAAPAAKPVAPTRRTAANRQPAERARTTSETADRSRPAFPAPAPASSASVPASPPAPAPVEPVESASTERPIATPEPPQKQYEDLVVPADSVIGLQVENAVSSDRAKVEDPVRARVSRDVKVRDQVAIPAGSRVEGSITLVDKGGRLKDQARLGIRFHTIVLADGTRLPINTETIYREGDSPTRESAAKIGGGAVGGAVLGAILRWKERRHHWNHRRRGRRGGCGGGEHAEYRDLAGGSTVTVRMSGPATVTVEK